MNSIMSMEHYTTTLRLPGIQGCPKTNDVRIIQPAGFMRKRLRTGMDADVQFVKGITIYIADQSGK